MADEFSYYPILNDQEASDTGAYQHALDSLFNELENARQQNDSIRMLIASNRLAFIFDNREIYDSAVIFYNRSIKLAEALGEETRLANMQNNLGNIFLAWGNYKKALDLYLASLNIFNKAEDSSGISKAYNNIGIIYYDWGDMDKSLGVHGNGWVVAPISPA